MKNVREHVVEKYLVDCIEGIGGECLKLEVKGRRGWPDRLVIIQDKIFFVELKRPKGGRLSELQKLRKHRLAGLGAVVYVLKNHQQIDALIEELK